jgi:hypothetical protein
MKILNEDSRSPGRDLNPGPLEYEAGVLSTQPRRSVLGLWCKRMSVTVEKWRQNKIEYQQQ